VFVFRATVALLWAFWIMSRATSSSAAGSGPKAFRRNMVALFILCIFVNVGMWFERFVIIVTVAGARVQPFELGVLQDLVHRGVPHRRLVSRGSSSSPGLHPGAAPSRSARIKETLPLPRRRAQGDRRDPEAADALRQSSTGDGDLLFRG